MRSMSCTGTGSIMSMSPESSAATRVASDLMVWKITSVRLCSGLPHQFGLGLNTVFTPGSWLTIVKGPVPLALSANGLSEVADADWACVAPFASDHFLEKMYQVSHSAVQDGVGRGEHEIDGVIVDLDGLHVGRRAALDLRAGAAHAVEREDHVVGGEVLAVVELDALAQMEAPLERVDDLPALGQARNDLEVLVALGQPLHDVAHGAERERLVQRVGIERVEVALEGVTEGLGAAGAALKASASAPISATDRGFMGPSQRPCWTRSRE